MTTSRDHHHTLGPDDARALDALVEAGFDTARVPATLRERAARVHALLSLLDAPAAHSNAQDHATLADVTMARVLRAGAAPAGTRATDDALLPDDELALEAYLGANFRAEKVPAPLRDRARRLDAMVALIAETPVPAHDPELVSRTMAAIPLRARRDDNRRWFAGVSNFRLADVVSLAAMLLLAVSVIWPLAAAGRSHQQQTACGSNMASIASALGTYGGDYRNALPVAAAGLGGPSWWDVGAGPGRSNSANLFTLAKNKYASLRDLACPGNAAAPCGSCDPAANDWGCLPEVSYSYQIMFGPQRPAWAMGPSVVVLADASPVIRRQRAGLAWHPTQNSANHGGSGQWIVRNDGSGGWLSSPIHKGDNIWLPGVVEVALRKIQDQVRAGATSGTIEIRGNELPDSSQDSFLGP
jgi:hypothetical protein